MQTVRTGLQVLQGKEWSKLRGQRVGAIVNPTSVDGDFRHLADLLAGSGATLSALFGPEHGVRGEAQYMEAVDAAKDPRTGVPVHSLYGHTFESLSPRPEWLTGLDAADPLVLPLIELLLRAAVRAPAIEGRKLAADAGGLQRLRPAIDRLRSNPADAPGAEQAAVLCALSPAYFSRRFKQQVGMSWSDYVRTHRLHLASRRLLETTQSIATIADALGFATPSHFGELFHRRFGITPGDYRQAGRTRPTSRQQ